MIKRNQISLKHKIKSYSLSFETKEFLESVDENILNQTSSVLGKERRAWFKGPYPDVVNEIDKQLRDYFEIDEDNKLIFSLYHPPKKVDGKFETKTTKLGTSKENILNRIIICTVPEQVEITFGKAHGEKMLMKTWEAYQSPPFVGAIMDYIFENKNHMQLEAKKGFRSTRRSKKIENRHILVFDYLVSNKDMEKLGNLISSKQSPSE
jgi:hypothetical protein